MGCDSSLLLPSLRLSGFNSRTPCGVRRSSIWIPMRTTSFNSRTPCGVRQKITIGGNIGIMFQFTHPVWGATTTCVQSAIEGISFNSRTPCGVRRLYFLFFRPYFLPFQFTHPVWGATYCINLHRSARGFNSRTPCGVRPKMHNDIIERRMVSIHAPRVGCDCPHSS